MIINHDLLFDLDTGEFFEGVANLPVGFAHVLRIKFIKNGVTGHELNVNSIIRLSFDQSFPVDTSDPIHEVTTLGFVFNPETQAYEVGFNATVRPLSIISLTTFATQLSITELGSEVTFDFHTKFRNAQLPAGVDPCAALNQEIDPDIVNFFRQNFRYTLLADTPDLRVSSSDFAELIDQLEPLDIVNIAGRFTTETDIPQGASLVDVEPPEGIDPAFVSSVIVQRVSGTEEVAVSNQYSTDSGNSRIFISSPPSSDGTHKLITTYARR